MKAIHVAWALSVFLFLGQRSSAPVFAESAKDPFAAGVSPSSVTVAAWEELLIRPKEFNQKVVSISGCIEVTVRESRVVMRLYKDRESYLLRRPKTFVELDDSDQFVAAIGKEDLDKWRLLDGKDVECWGTWQEHSLNDMTQNVGALKMPYFILVFGKHGEIFLQDKNAKWK